MTNLWRDLAEKLKLDRELFNRSYTVLGERAVIVEGQKSISSVSLTEVSFVYGKGLLCIYGENLTVKTLAKGFACVEGKIDKVEQI